MPSFSGTFQGSTHGGGGGGGKGVLIVPIIIVGMALVSPTAAVVGTAVGGWLALIGQIIAWVTGVGVGLAITGYAAVRLRDRRRVQQFRAHEAEIEGKRARGEIPAAPAWRPRIEQGAKVRPRKDQAPRQVERATATRLDR